MDDSFKRTRDTCKDLSDILSISPLTVHGFTNIVELALVHKALGEHLDTGDPMRITIPFICDMFVTLDDKDNVVIENIVLDDRFKSHISKAIKDGESPFVAEAEASLINRIKNKYDSLI